jgi:hypothetical protein
MTDGADHEVGPPGPADEPVPHPIALPIGPRGVDARSGEPVRFSPVAPGASPHVAIIGGVGSGKTRTALAMLGKLREQTSAALLAFDFKGDMVGGEAGLDVTFGAEVVAPPRAPVPLDVLAVVGTDETALKLAGPAAARQPRHAQRRWLRSPAAGPLGRGGRTRARHAPALPAPGRS